MDEIYIFTHYSLTTSFDWTSFFLKQISIHFSFISSINTKKNGTDLFRNWCSLKWLKVALIWKVISEERIIELANAAIFQIYRDFEHESKQNGWCFRISSTKSSMWYIPLYKPHDYNLSATAKSLFKIFHINVFIFTMVLIIQNVSLTKFPDGYVSASQILSTWTHLLFQPGRYICHFYHICNNKFITLIKYFYLISSLGMS